MKPMQYAENQTLPYKCNVPHAHLKNKMKKYQLKTREVEAMQTCYRVEQCS